jgi:hypothetical protein
MLWGQSTIVGHYEGYCITQPKPKWIIIPTFGYFVKHHVLIHFGLWYYKDIVREQKDGMKLHYPFQSILKMAWGIF